MSVALYERAVRRHWRLVTVLAVLGTLLLGIDAWLTPPAYRAHVRLATAFGSTAPGAVSSTATSPVAAATELHTVPRLVEARVRAYAMMAASPAVLEPIVARLRLPYSAGDLAGRVIAWVPLDSTLIDIDVIDSDPVRAGTILAAIASALSDIASGEEHTAEPASTMRISVRDPVSLPFRPAPDRWPLYLLAGLAAGLAVGVGMATLRLLLAERRVAVPVGS